MVSDLWLLDLAFRSVQVAVLFRAGLLSLFMMVFTATIVADARMTFELSAWYSSACIVVTTIVLLLAAYSFWNETGGGRSGASAAP